MFRSRLSNNSSMIIESRLSRQKVVTSSKDTPKVLSREKRNLKSRISGSELSSQSQTGSRNETSESDSRINRRGPRWGEGPTLPETTDYNADDDYAEDINAEGDYDVESYADDYSADDHGDDYSGDDYARDDYSGDDYTRDDYARDDYSGDDYGRDEEPVQYADDDVTYKPHKKAGYFDKTDPHEPFADENENIEIPKMLRGEKFVKLRRYYKWYVLALVTLGYMIGELGHFLIGTTSRVTAEDLDYGDLGCMLKDGLGLHLVNLPVICEMIHDQEECESLTLDDMPKTHYCEYDYNGEGMDYQILAGPAFMAVFTIVGVIMGIIADRYNRARVLAVCTVVFVTAIFLMGTVKRYWQMLVLRMVLAAGESGCNPLSTGILTDLFRESQRAMVLSVFIWGIYGGYGLAFPVGRELPHATSLSWRLCYFLAGGFGAIIAFLTIFTLNDPKRTDSVVKEGSGPKISIWKVLKQLRFIMLCIAASVRHCGGMAFAYNADLYYREYFPDVDLSWWLFLLTVFFSSLGVVAGGYLSDKYVSGKGIKSRVLIIALSQAIATPFAMGSIVFQPLLAMLCLGFSLFFSEMWFGIMFTVLVEIVPLSVRSTCVGIFLFVMNNVGGNLPIIVDPLSKAMGYRAALLIFYPGLYGLSSVLFFLTYLVMGRAEAG